MRQIVLDTETTGLSPKDGHRIIEIGCVEMVDRQFTGEKFHTYINPQRLIEAEAIEVHGITDHFVADKPLFGDIVNDFLAFISGAELIIHNAPFDVGFMDHEFRLAGLRPYKTHKYCQVLDTLAMAREKHPGQKNNLDALCKRYKIDNSNRQFHGALLDANILAQVYLAMTGGQACLFADSKLEAQQHSASSVQPIEVGTTPLTVIKADELELAAHLARITVIAEKSGVSADDAGWD